MHSTLSVHLKECPQVSSTRRSPQTRRTLMAAANWDGYRVEQGLALQPAADSAYRQLYVGLAGTNQVAGGLLVSQVTPGLCFAFRHCLRSAYIYFVCPANLGGGAAASACTAAHAEIGILHGQKDVAVQERSDRICPSGKLGDLPGQHQPQHFSPCEAQASTAPGTSFGASVLSLCSLH